LKSRGPGNEQRQERAFAVFNESVAFRQSSGAEQLSRFQVTLETFIKGLAIFAIGGS
jgi:hypothetical protein